MAPLDDGEEEEADKSEDLGLGDWLSLLSLHRQGVALSCLCFALARRIEVIKGS